MTICRFARRSIAIAACLAIAAACTSDQPGSAGGETDSTQGPRVTTQVPDERPPTLSTIGPPGLRAPRIARTRVLPEADTAPLEERLPRLDGQTITILGPETDAAADSLVAAFSTFEELTGATIDYTGTTDDVTVLTNALEGEGTIPDIVIVDQPGRLAELSTLTNGAKAVTPAVEAAVRANFDSFWADLVQFDRNIYGVPSKASVKSLVWYSPTRFERLNYQVPVTLEELDELTGRMRFEGRTPWCIGIAAGSSTGWVVTDWIEDFLLRRHGPEVYDQWVSHRIPANDERILEVVEEIGAIWHEPDNVLVDDGPEDIATTGFAEAGLPLLEGDCMLHRQASFYGGNYAAEGAEFGTDVDAFYLPTADDRFGQVVLGAGDYFAPMRNTPATTAFLTFAADPVFADARAAASNGGVLSANRFQDTTLYSNLIDERAAEILVQADPFRFDGSDLMPAIVGAGELRRAGTSFAANAISAEEYLDRVEAAWSLAG